MDLDDEELEETRKMRKKISEIVFKNIIKSIKKDNDLSKPIDKFGKNGK